MKRRCFKIFNFSCENITWNFPSCQSVLPAALPEAIEAGAGHRLRARPIETPAVRGRWPAAESERCRSEHISMQPGCTGKGTTMIGVRARRDETRRPDRATAVRPALEGLEGRLLLSSTTGARWARPQRITYSFVPDGTSIGGVPSNLQATLERQVPRRQLEGRVRQGRRRLAEGGQRQLRPGPRRRLADRRRRQPAGRRPVRRHPHRRLRATLRPARVRLPAAARQRRDQRRRHLLQHEPSRGGSTAPPSTWRRWRSTSSATPWGWTTRPSPRPPCGPPTPATKQVLTTDDIGGIRGIYDARRDDSFDANGSNNISGQADDITSYLDASGQLTLSGLDSTTPTGDRQRRQRLVQGGGPAPRRPGRWSSGCSRAA